VSCTGRPRLRARPIQPASKYVRQRLSPPAVQGPILCRSAPQGAPGLANDHHPHPPHALHWTVWPAYLHRDHGPDGYRTHCRCEKVPNVPASPRGMPVAARLVQAVGRARQAPTFRRRRGREDRIGSRTTRHVGTGPIADVVRDPGIAPMVPPATAPERRHRTGSASGLHQAGRYGHAPRRRRDVHPLFQLQWVQGAPCGADRHKIGPYDPWVARHWRACFEAGCMGRVLSAEGTENKLRTLRPGATHSLLTSLHSSAASAASPALVSTH
jgi:hypothetical protein